MTLLELKQALRTGPHAWPSSYPLYFLARDGSALSFAALRGEIRQVLRALRHPGTDCWWEIDAACINWEESDLVCDHTDRQTPYAYPGD